MSTPVWLHGPLSKKQAEDTFNEAVDSRAPQTGQFFVYGRVGKDKSEELVLCVVYKEKLTHHLTQFVDGSWVINKKSYGHFATIEELVLAMGSPVKGWPVPLIRPVPRLAAAEASWLHPPMNNVSAEELLAGHPNGHFVVRKRAGGQKTDYILSINYKNKPTHHLVTENEEGNLTCNKRAFGETSQICVLLMTIASNELPKGWPVAAQSFSPVSSPEVIPPSEKPPAIPAIPAQDTQPRVEIEADTGRPKWLHESMNNEAAAALLPDGAEDGTFLIRERDEGEYVVTVVYRSKPTHHLSKWDDGDECYLINKKPLEGAKSITDVVDKLRTEKTFWPVPLRNSINVDPVAMAQKEEEKRAIEKAAQIAAEEARLKAEEDERIRLAEEARAAEEARLATEKVEAERLAAAAEQKRQDEAAALKEAEEAAARKVRLEEEATARHKQRETERAERELTLSPAKEAVPQMAQSPEPIDYTKETWHDEEDGGVMGFGTSEDSEPSVAVSAVAQQQERSQASPEAKVHEPASRSGKEDSGMKSCLEPTQRIESTRRVEIGKPGGELGDLLTRKLKPARRSHADFVQPTVVAVPPRPSSPVSHDQKKEEWSGLSGDGDGLGAVRMAAKFGGSVALDAASAPVEPQWKREKREKREREQQLLADEKRREADKIARAAEESRLAQERREQSVDSSSRPAKDIRAAFANPTPKIEPDIRRRKKSQEELDAEAREAERIRIAAEQEEQKKQKELAEKKKAREAALLAQRKVSIRDIKNRLHGGGDVEA